MRSELKAALAQKVTTMAVADRITARAFALYLMGLVPKSISKAQMAAVGQRIRRAKTLADAEKDAIKFLKHQMDKLQKRLDAGGKRTSWLKETSFEGQKRPLGTVVIEWIEKRRYLTLGKDTMDPTLAGLQQFWNQVESFFRYHHTTGEKAPISKEIFS